MGDEGVGGAFYIWFGNLFDMVGKVCTLSTTPPPGTVLQCLLLSACIVQYVVSATVHMYCTAVSATVQIYCTVMSAPVNTVVSELCHKYCTVVSVTVQIYCTVVSATVHMYCTVVSATVQI